MTASFVLQKIVTVLPRFAYRFGDEKQLHEGIAEILTKAGISFEREYVADPKDRYDFLCAPGIVIEAKVHGSLSPAIRQCSRYAKHDNVTAIVIATSRFWGRMRPFKKDAAINGKPVRLVQLRGQAF